MKRKTRGINAASWFYSQSFNQSALDHKPQPAERRTYVEGCGTCDQIKADGGFGPAHDASRGCESGQNRYPHCSCSMCF